MLCIFCESKYEAQLLLNKFKTHKVVTFYQVVVYETELNGKELIIVQTGEGKVNVAFAVGLIKEKYPISAIIEFGNCGYIGEKEIGLGEIAISNVVFQYDVDFQANHYRLFEIPGTNQVLFPSDTHLRQYALMACNYLNVSGHVGVFGTADRFIASNIIANHLNKSYHIEFIDVESAILGQLAYQLHLPFISVKGIAHLGDDEAFELFRKSFQKANQQSSDVVYTMLEALTRKNIYC